MNPNSKARAIFFLRRFSGIYRAARWSRNSLVALGAGLLRRLAPVESRFGPPRGFFSEYDLLQQGRLTGKVLLAGQEQPSLSPNSLRTICRFEQDKNQPWPVFWTYRGPARLVGPTLVVRDEQKRLSR